MSTEPPTRSMRALVRRVAGIDVVLAACLVALAVFTAVVADGNDVLGEAAPTKWWEWLLVIAPALPVTFRRAAPLVATPLSVVAQLVLWGVGLSNTFVAPLVMIYTVCADEGERGRRMGIGSVLALSAMTLLGVFVAPDVTFDLLVFTSLAGVMAVIVGVNAAHRRAEAVRLAEDLAVARVERDAALERAAAEERQRIARELHDIVGHSLSVIAVRAEGADRVAAKNPGAAVEAVAAIAATARQSLAEVRRALAGLRDESEVDLAPIPSLATLPALVSSFTEAGLNVEIVDGLPTDLSIGAAVGVSTYRLVQEALTNVLKHAGPESTAIVHLYDVDDDLVVCIEDDGRGPAVDSSPGIGSGLAGMRERAEVLGGRLEAGPRTSGGYAVVATIPIDTPVAATAKVAPPSSQSSVA